MASLPSTSKIFRQPRFDPSYSPATQPPSLLPASGVSIVTQKEGVQRCNAYRVFRFGLDMAIEFGKRRNGEEKKKRTRAEAEGGIFC
jgi:hypothetical protein